MRWNTRLLVAIIGLFPAVSWGQLSASVNDQDNLVISATNLDLLAVEFQSPSGSLITSENADPFQGVVTRSDTLALYFNLGSPLTLDGSLTLSTKWDSTKRNDVLFQYGTLLEEEPLQPITGHQRFNSDVSEEPVIAVDTEPDFSSQEIDVPDGTIDIPISAPSNVIVASASEDGLFLFDEFNLSVVSLSIQSEAGLLVPHGTSPFFDEMTSNTPFEVSYVSDSEVSLHGDFFLPVGWTGDDFSDLTFDLITADGESLLVEPDVVRALPEPSSGFLLFACLLFSALRWRGRR